VFKYFPTNYVWNLSVDLAIEMGARIGEIEAMCAPLQEAARQPDAAGTKAFRETWSQMADKLCELAREDEALARLLSAGEKYNRAAIYYLTCERLQAHLHAQDLAIRHVVERLQRSPDSGADGPAAGSRVLAADDPRRVLSPAGWPARPVPGQDAGPAPAGHPGPAARLPPAARPRCPGWSPQQGGS